MAKFKPGQFVHWRFPPGIVSGEVIASFSKTTRILSKGKTITRHGTKKNPAYLLRTRKGVDVLKLESEIIEAQSENLSKDF